MILLDTNVVSEMMKGPRADPRVISWVWNLPEEPATTVLTRAEILAGLGQLPQGRRRQDLTTAAIQVFGRVGACLPFTPECADAYAVILTKGRQSGRPISTMDALIAAIALVSGSTLATRNIADFDGSGLDLVDPWALGG
ncbi:type II toxin-antitoxin system VapC family toxin [Kribbia dieselivorans]|uniref:type II toxin-antitoxin system VapC family toxin n=1 Tax=Kribbia dieselivorans TaxID=331526 RepID=UPI000837D3EB|nr:type II toxin-antitoxin system VapC family toxin [Kribbia dieselivorans]